jgi:hypothetical protein
MTDESNRSAADGPDGEPDMLEQTLALATLLKQISDRDPDGKPSETAARVFRSWLNSAREFTEEPQYFDDVAESFDVEGRSNRDLFDMFELLHPYVDIVDDRDLPDDEPPIGRAFIALPTI